MRRIGWMCFVVVLCSASFMYAQSSSNQMQMSGTVCQSACVVNNSPEVSTCDPLCTIKGGTAVLVSDKGNVMQIANQDICQSHMGKHVTLTAAPAEEPAAAAIPTEKQREQKLRIMELHDDPGGGE